MAALLSMGITACGPLPEPAPVRGLYVDVRKAVDFEQEVDWVADRLEVSGLLQNVMGSVCRTSPEVRRELLDWLDVQIAEAGGPAEELYEREGRERNRRVDRVLTLERTRMLLAEAHSIAEEDCPFWLEQDPDFRGVQRDEGRAVIIAESVGGAALFMNDGDITFGGGGVGRLVLAGGFSRRLTIGLGFGVGADGTLPPTDTGSRTFEALVSFQIPLIFRLNLMSRLVDFEVDLTTRMRGGSLEQPGVRFSVGYGLSTPRSAGFMPYALVWVGYETIVQPRGPVSHVVWLGTKVGFNWDP